MARPPLGEEKAASHIHVCLGLGCVGGKKESKQRRWGDGSREQGRETSRRRAGRTVGCGGGINHVRVQLKGALPG